MDWENWQEDYSGKTRLKDWWKMIKINLGIIKDNITGLKSDVDELPTKTELDKKADKETGEGGGFAGGRDTYTASISFMGVAAGREATCQGTGAALGYRAFAYTGGAAGSNAKADNGGGAVGQGALASGGFAGGKNAKTAVKKTESDGTIKYDPIFAVQLGEGLNSKSYTAQIFDYELVANDAAVKTATDGSKYLKDVGKLSSLQTTEKTNIVGAVNELKTQINALHGFGADFWTGFFKTGRTDFSYAFINNGAAEIKPSQAINATVIKYMLLNCSELADASPIVVNLSANNPVVVGVCMGCSKITKPPVINFTGENAHVCRSYVSAYANCAKLTQCTIWFGDGTQSASGERTDMANTFLNCSALTSLRQRQSKKP